MKLQVEAIEEIELTDPLCLCNPPAPRAIPRPQLPSPMTPQTQKPMAPFPGAGVPLPKPIPRTGDVFVPQIPSKWTRQVRTPNDPLEITPRWGVGGQVIQQAGDALEKEKWEKNWQAGKGGDVPEDGNGNAQ